MLLSKRLIKYPSLYEAPKGKQPPPLPIRALMVLTCTGVSFFHGSNDGKGHGPHHAHPHRHRAHSVRAQPRGQPQEIQDFIAASEQAGHILDRHVDKSAVLGPDAREEVTEYIRTRQLQPGTILALRELVEDRITKWRCTKCSSSPRARPDQRPQRYVCCQ